MAALALGVCSPLLLRAAWEGRAELTSADVAREAGRVDLEIVHLGRAARWRVPWAGHDETALARLLALGEAGAREDATSQTALMAHREARSALLATRGWGLADDEAMHAANRAIATAMAAQEQAFGSDLSGRGEAEVHHLALLGRAETGAAPWAPLAGLAVLAAVIGLRAGLPARGGVRRPALLGGLTLALTLAAIAWWLFPV